MKKVLLILACGIAAQLSYAQATPKWAGKAKKAVFSIVTYDKDNKIKNTGNGFYINENGTALSDYTLFEGAERAVIINADSKELPVFLILLSLSYVTMEKTAFLALPAHFGVACA